MHPDDLTARGIESGAVVRVTSRVGAVEVEVSGVDDMMPGVVSLPHGYGHQVEGTRLSHAATVAGVSINDLTDPDAPRRQRERRAQRRSRDGRGPLVSDPASS